MLATLHSFCEILKPFVDLHSFRMLIIEVVHHREQMSQNKVGINDSLFHTTGWMNTL